jgi:hypothetical protein
MEERLGNRLTASAVETYYAASGENRPCSDFTVGQKRSVMGVAHFLLVDCTIGTRGMRSSTLQCRTRADNRLRREQELTMPVRRARVSLLAAITLFADAPS